MLNEKFKLENNIFMDNCLSLEVGWDGYNSKIFNSKFIETCKTISEYIIDFFENNNVQIRKFFPAPASDASMVWEIFCENDLFNFILEDNYNLIVNKDKLIFKSVHDLDIYLIKFLQKRSSNVI